MIGNRNIRRGLMAVLMAVAMVFPPPFCCEGAPAFRRGEESQLSFFHITRNVVLLEI